MDEKRFGTNPLGKSVRDRNLIKTYFNKKASLASGLGGSKSQEANVTQGFMFFSEMVFFHTILDNKDWLY